MSFVLQTTAQIRGKITNLEGEPLSFVSIYLENNVTGTTSNDNGIYELDVTKTGTYSVVFQFLGFKTLKKNVTINSFPYELNVKLEEEKIALDEVTISTKENPANEIIRQVIKNKEKYTDKLKKYTADFYSRGLYRIKDAPEKFLGQNLGDFGGGLDSTRSGIIYLSETVSQIKFQKNPENFKENIVASKVAGEDNGISFNRAEDSNINFYENSVEFGNSLISPISANAFAYYKFKLEGSFYTDTGKLINKIKVTPKRKNDRVFEGFFYIVENEWAIYGADVVVTGKQINIPAVDKLKLKQNFNYSKENDTWVLISQTIDFKVDFLGFKIDGRFSSAYSNYDFAPVFDKNTFSSEVLTFEKNATEKDSVYWNNLRPVPLTKEEVKDYIKKDSIKVVRKSEKYLDSVDAIRNKLNWLSPITGYTYRKSYEDWSVSFQGLITDFSYNTVQGFNTSIGASYFKRLNDKGKWWSIGGNINYGFTEKKARPFVYFSKKWNNIKRPRFSMSLGVTTPQFNGRNPIAKLNNTFTSLLYRDNYMKIYEKTFTRVAYSQELTNGIFGSVSLEYAKRSPLFNTSNYAFVKQKEFRTFSSNNPLNPTDFTNAAFTEHNIATLNVGARFSFGQKYLSYPDSKVNIRSNKYPSISLNYIKRFAGSESRLNSDSFIANVRQTVSAGNYGNFDYHLRGGIFLEKKNIAFMDNLQVNGNKLFFPIDRELNSFNLLEYYKFFTNDRYAEGHFEYNFEGFILNKIPWLKKLNFHLIAGTKVMVMANQKPYSEYSIGFDNIGFGKFRFLRFEYVRSNFGGVTKSGFVFRANLFN